jgi:hypothetical protein
MIWLGRIVTEPIGPVRGVVGPVSVLTEGASVIVTRVASSLATVWVPTGGNKVTVTVAALLLGVAGGDPGLPGVMVTVTRVATLPPAGVGG